MISVSTQLMIIAWLFQESWFEYHMTEHVSVYYKYKVLCKLGILLLFNEVILMLRAEQKSSV